MRSVRRALPSAIVVLALLAIAPLARALPGAWSTGIVDAHLSAGQSVTYTTTPIARMARASLTLRYGLWNDPHATLVVLVNGREVGRVQATEGYTDPGPHTETWDVAEHLVPGVNRIEVRAIEGGEAIVGALSLDFGAAPDPAK